MTRYSTMDYPEEGMELAYRKGADVVTQCIFVSEKFGYHTLINGKWRTLAENDTSLEGTTIIYIPPANYKVVRQMFEAAQKENRYLKYDDVKGYEIVYEFDPSTEDVRTVENGYGSMSLGFHAFEGFDFADLEIDRGKSWLATDTALIYTFKSAPALKYFKINGFNAVVDSQIPSGKLLLSIAYKLISTSDAAEVYSHRQIFQLDREIFVYLESGYCEFHGHEIKKHVKKMQNVEALIICEPIEKILESFTLWLVEVDPIGFELLRRMNRDGFTNKLSITEDLMWMHTSDDLMDKWFHKMTDYADLIELGIELDTDNHGFMRALESEVSSANSFTKSDFFERHRRQDWVHPRGRNSNEDDDDEDDEEIPDLTDEDIEQLRKEARARQKESEELTFADVPPALQELIHDLIQRVENTIGFEDAEELSFDLRGFIEGRYKYTQSELSSQMAKHLRMLVR